MLEEHWVSCRTVQQAQVSVLRHEDQECMVIEDAKNNPVVCCLRRTPFYLGLRRLVREEVRNLLEEMKQGANLLIDEEVPRTACRCD